MSQREVALVGSNNTKAEITGQQELRIQVSSVTPGAGLASEATLLQVLSAVDNMRDYEVRLVQDSTAPNPVTWLEVRYWDAQSGTLGVPVYYLPGSTTPGSPVLPISYINDQSLLTQILGELQAIDNKLVSGNDIGDVTVNNAAGAAAVNIQDGGNSITVDGLVEAKQNGIWVLGANSGVDIGDVTINNTAGAGAVNIQDGGNSITVDGTVNVGTLPAITGTVALDAPTLSALENITVQNGSGIAAVNIQDGGNVISVDDAGGSLTVDGTVALDSATLSALENITVQNGAGAAAVNIQDGGNSITVDGAVTVSATNLDIRDLAFATDKVDVTGSTVTIQDGGNTITVDGTVNVGNFPATQNVAVTSIVEVEVKNDTGNPLPISGTVTITDGSGPVTVDGTVAATQSGTWNINNISGTISLPTGAATESTLSSLNSQFTAVTRTPALIRATGSGTIAAGARSISVFNSGSAAGSILGVAGNILPGEVFEFSAGGENDTLSAFAYNGTGTTLVITSIV